MRAALAGLLFLSACAAQQPPTSAPANAEEATVADACGAHRFQNLIGTQADQIDRSTLPGRARFITPGMMVTQDFSAERLNIFVGVDGRVGSLRCF